MKVTHRGLGVYVKEIKGAGETPALRKAGPGQFAADLPFVIADAE